jgi:hypothetical protein
MTWRPTVVRACLLAACLGSCGWEPLPEKKPPADVYAFGIRIAPETTQITAPLLPNRTPDYAAAINASTGMGVNLENNAAASLAPVVGMDLSQAIRERLNVPTDTPKKRFQGGFSKERFEEYLGLGSEASSAETPGARFDAFQSELEVLDRGYCSTTDCPELAAWLGANDEPLVAIATAAEKARFWVPLGEGENLLRSKSFRLDGFEEVCRALGARASLSLGDEAWSRAADDLLTVQRLAGLLGQSTLAAAQSSAARCIEEGNEALLRAATDPSLDVAAARRLLDELEELPPIGNFELVLQQERFESLAGIFLLRESAGETGTSSWKEILAGRDAPEGLYRLEVSSVDWIEAIAVVNRTWDLARELVWSSSETAAAQSRQKLQDELRFTSQTSATLSEPQLGKLLADVDRDPEARPKLTRAFVDAAGLLPEDFVPFLRGIQEALSARDLGLVALALATHRKERSKLPASLDTLAPDYLDRMPPATQFGHVLRVNRGDSGALALTLVPQVVNVTGSRSYCVDSEGRSIVLGDGREPAVVDGRCSDAAP